jgi:hypothetical protein
VARFFWSDWRERFGNGVRVTKHAAACERDVGEGDRQRLGLLEGGLDLALHQVDQLEYDGVVRGARAKRSEAAAGEIVRRERNVGGRRRRRDGLRGARNPYLVSFGLGRNLVMAAGARALVGRLLTYEAHEKERDVRLGDRIPRRLFRVERAANGLLREILGLRLRLRQRHREGEDLLVDFGPGDGTERGVDSGSRRCGRGRRRADTAGSVSATVGGRCKSRGARASEGERRGGGGDRRGGGAGGESGVHLILCGVWLILFCVRLKTVSFDLIKGKL